VARAELLREGGLMFVKYCAVQAVTTEGTDIDVEIDQSQTDPPSNYKFSKSLNWLVKFPSLADRLENHMKRPLVGTFCQQDDEAVSICIRSH
jgi:hypothetical protein